MKALIKFTFQSGDIQILLTSVQSSYHKGFTFQSGDIQILFRKIWGLYFPYLHSNLVIFKSFHMGFEWFPCFYLHSNLVIFKLSNSTSKY